MVPLDEHASASNVPLPRWTLPEGADFDLLRALDCVHGAVRRRIEQALCSADLPPLAWVDLILVLRAAGPNGLRPAELEHRLSLPQYALSRLVAKIADAGLIERQPLAHDHRSFRVLLTELGEQMCHRLWPIYRSSLLSAIGLRLNAREAETLLGLLDRLATPTE